MCSVESSGRGKVGGDPTGVPHTWSGSSSAEREEQGDLGRTTHAVLILTIISMNCEHFGILFFLMQFGWTPLHFAAFHGHLNLVKKLIKVCKCSPEVMSKVQMDCLHIPVLGDTCTSYVCI